MTREDLLAIVRSLLLEHDRASLLALADAYEEMGDSTMAGWLREENGEKGGHFKVNALVRRLLGCRPGGAVYIGKSISAVSEVVEDGEGVGLNTTILWESPTQDNPPYPF